MDDAAALLMPLLTVCDKFAPNFTAYLYHLLLYYLLSEQSASSVRSELGHVW